MNLLNPGPGDLLDRLTILARKIVERPERKDFRQEFDDILRALFKTTAFNMDAKPTALLAALNAAIWQREDKIRGLRASQGSQETTHLEAVERIAFEIQDLNDRRAALVAEINGTPGEKFYK